MNFFVVETLKLIPSPFVEQIQRANQLGRTNHCNKVESPVSDFELKVDVEVEDAHNITRLIIWKLRGGS